MNLVVPGIALETCRVYQQNGLCRSRPLLSPPVIYGCIVNVAASTTLFAVAQKTPGGSTRGQQRARQAAYISEEPSLGDTLKH